MAPQKKNTSLTGVIYEPNNFIAFTTVDSLIPEEFHLIMKFLGESKLGYCLHEAPTTRKSTLDIGTLTSVRIATDVKSIYDIGYYKTDVF